MKHHWIIGEEMAEITEKKTFNYPVDTLNGITGNLQWCDKMVKHINKIKPERQAVNRIVGSKCSVWAYPYLLVEIGMNGQPLTPKRKV